MEHQVWKNENLQEIGRLSQKDPGDLQVTWGVKEDFV